MHLRAIWFGLTALVAAVAVASTAAVSQSSQAPPAAPVSKPGDQLLLARLLAGSEQSRYVSQLLGDFFQLDADSDGKITQRDVDLHALMEAAQMRTFALTSVMRFDLDGDGLVTEDEVRRTLRYTQRNNDKDQIESAVRSVMALDTDKDGKISLSEAGKFGHADLQRAALQNPQADRARQALTLANAATDELSLANYQAAGEALFRRIDTDNDGKVSSRELADYQGKPESPDAKIRSEAERAACAMPVVSEKAKLIALSSYQTDALSSVTLGSQDAVIHAGRIIVEPGNDPLYIVISAYSPAIWQFSGAVERIERVVMSSSRNGPNSGDPKLPPLVAATGIAPERITLLARSDCLGYFYETPSSSSLQALAGIRNATGKSPDVVAAKYSVGSFSVPSGRIESVREGPQPLVIEIDPKSVVAGVPIAAYEVLPLQAGLVQLLARGMLTQNGAGEYIVRQKIRFPAGLYGAHRVTFLVMKGAPYPDGDPGHSCVFVEETGESRGGGGCRKR